MGKVKVGVWDVPLMKGKPALVVVTIFLVLGGVVGILVAGQLQQEGGQGLQDYLSPLMEGVEQGSTLAPGIPSLFWEHGRWFLLLILAGLTPFGVFAIPLLALLRGFLLGYTGAILLCLFGTQGILLALILVTLPELSALSGFLLLGGEALLHTKELALSNGSLPNGQGLMSWLTLPHLLPCILAWLGALLIELWPVPLLLGWLAL